MKGLVVHGVLERLFALPAVDRTVGIAHALIEPSVDGLVESRPDVEEIARDPKLRDAVVKLLGAYFDMEDPTRLHGQIEVEKAFEVDTPDGVPLKGFIDRMDVAPNGAIRISDWKSGKAPSEAWEHKGLFQLKHYALAVWIETGTMPALLRLLYLATPTWLTYVPDEDELRRFSRSLTALWAAIVRASESGDFRPQPGFGCRFCAHHDACPAKGGVTPPYPGWPQAVAA